MAYLKRLHYHQPTYKGMVKKFILFVILQNLKYLHFGSTGHFEVQIHFAKGQIFNQMGVKDRI